MPIVGEAIPLVLVGLFVSVASFLMGWKVPSGLVFLLTVGVALFFRNPRRCIPQDKEAILSPADGKVMRIERSFSEPGFAEKVTLLSIFLSLANVHVNRLPVSGRVKEVRYRKGKFRFAFDPKAVGENERNFLRVAMENGKEIGFAQVAGFIARRIRCFIKPGDPVCAGERFGLIRFGSRADLFLPESVEVLVREGEKVRGGETILARFKS
ncbi:MAG: phosphatidylserine decarboxylase family protein [Deltaproteobacteria bacterium]|nr:phosphatidylserine decarboxylase family protein [Deltaproteobacteria bacterium]